LAKKNTAKNVLTSVWKLTCLVHSAEKDQHQLPDLEYGFSRPGMSSSYQYYVITPKLLLEGASEYIMFGWTGSGDADNPRGVNYEML
jgi:hypothetical protein